MVEIVAEAVALVYTVEAVASEGSIEVLVAEPCSTPGTSEARAFAGRSLDSAAGAY